MISGLYDNAAGKEAYERATNGYFGWRKSNCEAMRRGVPDAALG